MNYFYFEERPMVGMEIKPVKKKDRIDKIDKDTIVEEPLLKAQDTVSLSTRSRSSRKSRLKFFSISIVPSIQGEALSNFSASDFSILFDLIKFLTNRSIKNAFNKVQFKDRGRRVFIKNFTFQLEKCQPCKPPYWFVIGETNILTSRISLHHAVEMAIAENLEMPSSCKSFRVITQLHDTYQKLNSQVSYSLPLTEWSIANESQGSSTSFKKI